MLACKAMSKYLDEGAHAETLDFPGPSAGAPTWQRRGGSWPVSW